MSKKIELSEDEEILVKEVMEELGLKGGKDKRLISTVGKRTKFDKQRMIVAIKRALIGREEANE
jgi:8-oxo-dGTP pyrophosphatase MutT (NUDIX family)